jgi:hypothetical protein
VPGAVDVILPGGLFVDGERRQDAAVRPLTGEDEAFVAHEVEGLSPAARATALLARCLERLGSHAPVGEAAVRELTAGDREALLLQLRRVSFGERLECVLTCPEPECGERMDLELRVGDLLLEPYADARPEYEAGGFRFRLPTGADLEEAALAAGDGLEAAERLLLERCVLAGEPDGRLDDLMSELDPQADLRLELACPDCEHAFTVAFDAGDFLAREIGADREALLGEIHLLALHYHWPESELMAMPARRRRRYLAYLKEALGT